MRLFLAVFPPLELAREIRRRLAPEHSRLPRARWVRPALMHITLHFFGERPDGTAEKIANALLPVTPTVPPMRLELGDVGSFSKKRPHTVWLAVRSADSPATGERSSGAGVLEGLQRSIEQALLPLGEPAPRRRFRPHLTLARCKGGWTSAHVERARAALAPLEGRHWTAKSLDLMASELSTAGPSYSVVRRLALGRDARPS